MSIEISEAKRPGMMFWFWWVLASVGGILVYSIVDDQLSALFVRWIHLPATVTPEMLFVLRTISGGVMGLCLGLAQWLVLRRYRSVTYTWVLATTVGYLLCSEISLIAQVGISLLFFDTLTFLKSGIVLGIVQWFVLRKRIYQAGWWIVTSFLSWLFAVSIIFVEYLAGVATQPWVSFTLLFVPIFVSGGAMLWLLRLRTPAITRDWKRRIAISFMVILICTVVGLVGGAYLGLQQITVVDPWKSMGKPPQPAIKILLADVSYVSVQTVIGEPYQCCWTRPPVPPTYPNRDCDPSRPESPAPVSPPPFPGSVVDRRDIAKIIESCEYVSYVVIDDGSVWRWQYSMGFLTPLIPLTFGAFGCVGGLVVSLLAVFLFFAIRGLVRSLAT